jgi:hypothetical protein
VLSAAMQLEEVSLLARERSGRTFGTIVNKVN